MRRLFCAIAVVVLTAPALRAENGVRPGEFIIEPPTLICLGFEWAISGDDNRNATVDVSYRRAGDSQWRDALPLLRMGGEKIFRAPYTVPDRFAGSILDLDPDTAYEVRLTMKDPDGVSGQAVQLVKVRTRAEPKAAAGGRVLHVYPPTWRAAKEEPNFTGLMAAYAGAGTGDWNVVFQNKVGPGDTILVHAGLYKGDRHNYVDPLSTTFDGAYLLTAKGTRGAADRHQGGWRRRGDLRRRRRLSSLRRDGRRLQHLRRSHDPEYRGRVLGGREGRRRRDKGWPSATAGSRTSASASSRSLRDRRSSISRTTSFLAATIAIGCSGGPTPASTARIRSTAISR